MSLPEEKRQKIRDEIMRFSGPPNKREGDISSADVQQELSCNPSRAHRVLNRMVESGEYEKIKVYDPELQRACVVARKVSRDEPLR